VPYESLGVSPENDVSICSRQPFTLGALRPLRVHVKRGLQGTKDGDTVKHQHALQVEGPVLPCRMRALVHAVMSRQDEFTVQYTTDARTLGLNGAINNEQREIGVPGEHVVVQRVRRTAQGLILTTGSVAG
jgi:hypothetical protein